VDARKWVAIVATLCGISLGAGIPLLGLTAVPHTEMADGVVVWVHPADRQVLLHDTGGEARLRGRSFVLYLPDRGRVRIGPGHLTIAALRPGDRIRARISRHSHVAHWVIRE
jgi:hypothetical protein